MTHDTTTWLTGERDVPRTGRTPLTDDELVICDALFSGGAYLDVLDAATFHETFNVSYRHGVAFERLPEFLRSMERRGLVTLTKGRFGCAVDLTRKGGESWEQERLPNWDAYLHDQYPGGDRPALVVSTTHRELAEDFLRVATEARVFDLADGASTSIAELDGTLVPWRPERIVVLTTALSADKGAVTNWRLYESRRKWWRTLRELLVSKGLHTSPLPSPLALWEPDAQ